MNINPVILSIPIYFLLIGIELMIQFFSKKHIYRLNDAVTNISCGITQQVTGAFIKVFTIAAFLFVSESWAIMDIPVTWWSVILLVLGVDFCYYWAHRMSHEINLFWGGHVVHHQSEDYNFSVALRQGSFQGIWTFWFYMPLAFLGFDPTMFLLISALNTVYQFWIHTETIGKLPKPIEFIFNTPSHHRVHHGRDPKYIDKNHAGSLIIWDRMFGTFQEEEERPTYGITKPINTWNPVWANLQHYVDMAGQLRETPGFMNKMGVVWNKPGWRPQELGGYQAAPEVDKSTYAKYNTTPAFKLSLYVLVQFIAVLGITSLFLFTADDLLMNQKLAFSTLIIWSVAQFGVLFDNQTRWVNLEYIRIIVAAITVTLLFDTNWISMICGAYALISTGWFFYVRKEDQKVEAVKA
ncbi:sterol desaturase family protein [Marinoscillum sp.]|uniref:sterol desaturase family protein n=1 Tax=Marinoscillum sp. TaxID=2024838 RepID=UPI003BACE43D